MRPKSSAALAHNKPNNEVTFYMYNVKSAVLV